MPYEERIIEGEGYALILSYGEISAQQRVAVMQRLLREPAFAPGMPVLVDGRQLESLPASGEVEQIARAQAKMLAGHPVAFLTTVGAKYGAARQAAVLAESVSGEQVGVFTDHDEAVAWLRAFLPRR